MNRTHSTPGRSRCHCLDRTRGSRDREGVMRTLCVVMLLGLVITIEWPGIASSAQLTRGVALIELFTSEGCSSCPPADALLERIVADAGRSARPVYGLSFHVDYWNQL